TEHHSLSLHDALPISPAGELDAFFKKHGYIPALREGEKETISEVNDFERRQPVAVTLGTSYDIWCLAQLAKALGKKEEYEFFLRSEEHTSELQSRENL